MPVVDTFTTNATTTNNFAAVRKGHYHHYRHHYHQYHHHQHHPQNADLKVRKRGSGECLQDIPDARLPCK